MLNDEQRVEASVVTHVLAELGFFFTFGSSSGQEVPAWRLTLTTEAKPEGPSQNIDVDLFVKKPWLLVQWVQPQPVADAAFLSLLQLNGRLLLARVGLTPERHLVVWTQVYFQQLDLHRLRDAVGAVTAGAAESLELIAAAKEPA